MLSQSKLYLPQEHQIKKMYLYISKFQTVG